MKASRDQVRQMIETSKPFINELRMKWAERMISTQPGDRAQRESYYAMIAGLNGLENALSAYANGGDLTVLTDPDRAVERDWYGNPMKEPENG